MKIIYQMKCPREQRTRPRSGTHCDDLVGFIYAYIPEEFVLPQIGFKMAAVIENHTKTGGEQTECQKRVVASRVDDACAEVETFKQKAL